MTVKSGPYMTNWGMKVLKVVAPPEVGTGFSGFNFLREEAAQAGQLSGLHLMGQGAGSAMEVLIYRPAEDIRVST